MRLGRFASIAVTIVATLAFGLIALVVLVGFEREAHAETLQAPYGGRAIALGSQRIACGAMPGGWIVESMGRAVRPPASASSVGQVVELKVASSMEACARSTDAVKLVTTGRWPRLDRASFSLSIDEGRLEGRGRDLKGTVVTFPAAPEQPVFDTCREPQVEGGAEICTWRVPKTVSADPGAGALRWRPAGADVSPDAVLFDLEGKRADPALFTIAPSRVQVTQIVPVDAAVDVSSGTGIVPLLHPEIISAVECGNLRCSVEASRLAVQAPPASVTTLDIKFRLAPHVTYTKKGTQDPQPVVKLSILRCPMTVVSGPALRGIEGARVIVRLEGQCSHDIAQLHFAVGSRRTDVVQTETINEASYAVLAIGNVDAPQLSITAARGDGEGSVVAIARTDTKPSPLVRSVLVIPGYPPIDFIPNNRSAQVHHPSLNDAALALLPVQDVYTAGNEGGVSTVQGEINAAGYVALRFGYRNPTLPAPLDRVDLAVLTDPLQRMVKEAALPAPIGTSVHTNQPLVELVCYEDGRPFLARPGVIEHLSYDSSDSCRVVFHRERLSAEYGTQKLQVDIDVRKLDGSVRPEAKVSQTVILRAGNQPRIAWIKGVAAPYDRISVRISHVPDETHYLGALEILGAPSVQWSIILGKGRVRLYATTAIPTGLYRFSDSDHSGVMSLNFGIISRFTWLDSDGKEGLLGLEGGIMAFGLTGSTGPSGKSLTEVGAVLGLGLAIPIANAASPTQASINLHAWVEQRITSTGDEGANPRAIIFGPSISIGNVGTTF
ncbi:hypothetical protein [Pendulispora albinea]|uniref:Uncharacterized protein n=1 Tax=Pendulispora albinea TaxID=2741071 RepID=A0ABZ2M1L2_9BACT